MQWRYQGEGGKHVLSRGPTERSTGEYVKVDMEHCLVGLAVCIENGPVAALSVSALARDGGGAACHLANQRVMVGAGVVQRSDVLLWNNEHVHWCLRVDVLDGDHPVIFVDELRRNLMRRDSAKQAGAHAWLRATTALGMFCRSARIFTRDNAVDLFTSSDTASSWP